MIVGLIMLAIVGAIIHVDLVVDLAVLLVVTSPFVIVGGLLVLFITDAGARRCPNCGGTVRRQKHIRATGETFHLGSCTCYY